MNGQSDGFGVPNVNGEIESIGNKNGDGNSQEAHIWEYVQVKEY